MPPPPCKSRGQALGCGCSEGGCKAPTAPGAMHMVAGGVLGRRSHCSASLIAVDVAVVEGGHRDVDVNTAALRKSREDGGRLAQACSREGHGDVKQAWRVLSHASCCRVIVDVAVDEIHVVPVGRRSARCSRTADPDAAALRSAQRRSLARPCNRVALHAGARWPREGGPRTEPRHPPPRKHRRGSVRRACASP